MGVKADYHPLLMAAQSGSRDQLAALAEAFAAAHDPGDFGRLAHPKSGDGLLHVLARAGHVDCLRFLVEEYSGRQHVDVEIRWGLCLKVRYGTYFSFDFK
jgi:hypothetical protein